MANDVVDTGHILAQLRRDEVSEEHLGLIESILNGILDEALRAAFPDDEEEEGPAARPSDDDELNASVLGEPWVRERILDRLSRYPINLIPSDAAGSCKDVCVSLALDSWGAKEGFVKVAQKTIILWLACCRINEMTLIVTTAWDGRRFDKDFGHYFAGYASSKHMIYVVLLSRSGYQIVYSRTP